MKDRVLDLGKVYVKGALRALAAASLAAAPLCAQNSVTAAAPPVGNSSDIGPGELSNFSLNGTVTRPADRPPVTVPPPATISPSTGPAAAARDKPAANATPAPSGTARPRTPDDDLFRRPPTLPDASGATSVSAMPPPTTTSGPSIVPPPATGFSIFPWIVGLLAMAGGGLLWFGRRRRGGQRYASAGNAPIDIVRPDMPTPRADPPVASPRPDPAGPASPGAGRRPLPTTLMPQPSPPVHTPREPVAPVGIVATGLRPWIDVELSPDRALLDEQGAAIAFEVTLYNSGSAAARDVIIEAKLLNAGASQDVELSAFFSANAAVGDPIPQIVPYARIPLRSAVRLPRDAISEYDYEGRKLFMPMVAISVRYRWSGGNGQSAAGFLVGQGAAGQERLAPLRVDRGARSWNGLYSRRYEKGVRR